MRIVVVGASVAGVTTAEAVRAEGFDGEVVLIGDEPHAPYARPPLSKQVLDGSWEPSRAALRTRDELDALGVELRTGTRATALDVERQVVTADGPVPYDVLVIATGVEPVPLSIPGGEGALRLRTLDDASTLRRAMTSTMPGGSSGMPVAMIGAGVLGSELASAARHLGREVVLVGRGDRLAFGTLGTLLSDRLAALHLAHGVQLRTGSGVVRLDQRSDGGTDVVLADGTVIASAFAVAAVGGRPRTDWLAGSGLVLDDGIACDVAGRAIDGRVVTGRAISGRAVHGRAADGLPVASGVFAIGDVAAWTDPVSGRQVRIEHQTTAIEQGLAVAHTIVHGTSSTAPAPYFWSEVHGVRIQAYGTFDRRRPLTPIDQPTPSPATASALAPALAPAPGPALAPAPGAPSAPTPDRFVAASIDQSGRTTGVVGWAAARAFRTARSLVDESRTATTSTTPTATATATATAALSA